MSDLVWLSDAQMAWFQRFVGKTVPRTIFAPPNFPKSHRKLRSCIPGRMQRKAPVKYDKRRYKRRNRIEIMLGRLKDWRRVATRYDRCPKIFLSAIAASVIFWH